MIHNSGDINSLLHMLPFATTDPASSTHYLDILRVQCSNVRTDRMEGRDKRNGRKEGTEGRDRRKGRTEGTNGRDERKGQTEGTSGRDRQKGRTGWKEGRDGRTGWNEGRDRRKEGTDARLPKVKMKMRALIKKQKDVCKMCLDRYHFIIPIYCNNILLVPGFVVLEVCKDPHWSCDKIVQKLASIKRIGSRIQRTDN